MNLKNICILFDVDDTLYDQFSIFEKSYNKVFGDKYKLDLNLLYNKSRYYSEHMFKLVETNEKTIEDLYVYRMKKPFEDFGYHISDDDAILFQKVYAENQNYIAISENMKQVIEFCSSNNIKMGIITNGLFINQWQKIEGLGILNWIGINDIFISESVGLSKPDLNLFKYVEEEMNLSKEYTYYIGDSLNNDVLGVDKIGWNMIWLNKRNLDIDNLDVNPKYILNSDAEILNIVKEIIAS